MQGRSRARHVRLAITAREDLCSITEILPVKKIGDSTPNQTFKNIGRMLKAKGM